MATSSGPRRDVSSQRIPGNDPHSMMLPCSHFGNKRNAVVPDAPQSDDYRKITQDWIRDYEPGGREFESLRARQSLDTGNSLVLLYDYPNQRYLMAATSLKLPDDLKRRIERLAENAQKSAHAFMIEALAREAERSELREQFAADAAESEKEAMATGKAFDLTATFGYLQARLSGRRARRPRARAWRASR